LKQKELWSQPGVVSPPLALKARAWRPSGNLGPFARKEEEVTYIHERKVPTAAQREARQAFKEADAKVAISEYERAQQAFHANRERLKAEVSIGLQI
jgi:hypothetical protein